MIALILCGGLVDAQSRASNDPDTKAIESYRLTLPVLEKIGQAYKHLAAALKNDPAAQRQLDADDDKSNDNESLAEMERRIAAMPHMSEALKSVGLTAHEYTLFQMCALQAGMAAGLEKAGQLPSLPAGVQAANVQFMKDHEKEFAALQNGGGTE
jgi:hypothetical protein